MCPLIYPAPGVGVPMNDVAQAMGPDALRVPAGPLPADPAADASLSPELQALKQEADHSLRLRYRPQAFCIVMPLQMPSHRLTGLRSKAALDIAGFRQLSLGSLNVNYPLWPEPSLLGGNRRQAMWSQLSIAKAVSELAGAFSGRLLQPGDGGYDEARRVHNGMVDKRPALIAQCAGTADVAEAVNLARI